MKLRDNFIVEVLKVCLEDLDFYLVCSDHLKYEFLQTESEKLVYRFINNYHNLHNKLPTLGTITQNLPSTDEIISLLSKIKDTKVTISQKDLLPTLEAFIKKSRFVSLYDQTQILYSKKPDEAIAIMAKESEIISNFSIKDKQYKKVFADWEVRESQRQLNQDNLLLEKTTFGIPELDDMFYGGPNKGVSVLWMAPSGVGKSTVLRWVGISNARQGRVVVHFQLEGSEKECLDAYDAGWAGLEISTIEFGGISENKKAELNKTATHIKKVGGEIFVYGFESFGGGTIEQCREILIEISKKYKVDVVLFDYAELLQTKGRYGNDESSERKRRGDIAEKLTNLAVEFKVTVHTATQSRDIDKLKLSNDDFCISRNDISEFKGFIKPFSYFFTLNQTPDEYEHELMRIYIDKVRKYKINKRVIRFYQARNVSRFYDAYKTKMELS